MAKESLSTTFKRLNSAIFLKVPIIVEIQYESVKNLLETLETVQVLKIAKKYQNSYLVKVKKQVSKIEVLTKPICTRKHQISEFVKKIIPSEEGHLILSTTKAVMSHKEAAKRQIAGKILGFVQ